MAEIATTLAPPQVAYLAEAALGCFKDEMLHLLTKKRIDFQFQQSGIAPGNTATATYTWDSTGACSAFPASVSGFQYGPPSFGNEGDGSPWNQSICTGSTCTAGDQQGRMHEKLEDENGDESEGGKGTRNGSSIFNSECVLWDIPSDDLMNPI